MRGGVSAEIKVRFEFEIDQRKSDDFAPADFDYCETLDQLREELMESAEHLVSWRMDVNSDDLEAFWAAVQKLRAEDAGDAA